MLRRQRRSLQIVQFLDLNKKLHAHFSGFQFEAANYQAPLEEEVAVAVAVRTAGEAEAAEEVLSFQAVEEAVSSDP